MSDWSSDVCSSDLRHRENLRLVRAWPPPILRRLRHRALLYQRGDVSWADRRAERDARRHRQSHVQGKSVSVRVDTGGRRIIKNKTHMNKDVHTSTRNTEHVRTISQSLDLV